MELLLGSTLLQIQTVRLINNSKLRLSQNIARDLGQFIRKQVKINFAAGVATNVNEKECEEVFNSLKRIADNYYCDLYKRHSESSATGLTAEQCNSVLSDEFLMYINKKEENIVKRMLRK